MALQSIYSPGPNGPGDRHLYAPPLANTSTCPPIAPCQRLAGGELSPSDWISLTGVIESLTVVAGRPEPVYWHLRYRLENLDSRSASFSPHVTIRRSDFVVVRATPAGSYYCSGGARGQSEQRDEEQEHHAGPEAVADCVRRQVRCCTGPEVSHHLGVIRPSCEDDALTSPQENIGTSLIVWHGAAQISPQRSPSAAALRGGSLARRFV